MLVSAALGTDAASDHPTGSHPAPGCSGPPGPLSQILSRALNSCCPLSFLQTLPSDAVGQG